MTLARIYPFFRKDGKMKLDRVKEEIANIRQCFLFGFLMELNSNMKNRLKELEKTGKDE